MGLIYGAPNARLGYRADPQPTTHDLRPTTHETTLFPRTEDLDPVFPLLLRLIERHIGRQ